MEAKLPDLNNANFNPIIVRFKHMKKPNRPNRQHISIL